MAGRGNLIGKRNETGALKKIVPNRSTSLYRFITATVEVTIPFQDQRAKGEGRKASQNSGEKHAITLLVTVRCNSRRILLRLLSHTRMTARADCSYVRGMQQPVSRNL